MHFLNKNIRKSLLLVLIFVITSFGQIYPDSDRTLIKIEDAFNNGEVTKIAEYLSDKTYFSYTPDLTGYFSYSQLFSLIKEYFNAYKPIKFKFMSKSTNSPSPFGWGDYVYLKNGIRGSHKIFISLDRSGPNFYISQISIN
jgi:hypothetical protein